MCQVFTYCTIGSNLNIINLDLFGKIDVICYTVILLYLGIGYLNIGYFSIPGKRETITITIKRERLIQL